MAEAGPVAGRWGQQAGRSGVSVPIRNRDWRQFPDMAALPRRRYETTVQPLSPRPYRATSKSLDLRFLVRRLSKVLYVQKVSGIPATGAPVSLHAPVAPAFCPGGTFGNSSAFQRPNQPGAKARPEGTAESVAGYTSTRRSIVLSASSPQASLRDAGSLGVVPGAEALVFAHVLRAPRLPHLLRTLSNPVGVACL
jgi:hypothetical protein